MLVLERRGDCVYHEGRKLTIVKQASKGENQEVVKIEGLPGSNGCKWKYLKKLQEGENIIPDEELVSRNTGSSLRLTVEEQARIAELQKEIDAIKENARKRSSKPTKIEDMNAAELQEYVAKLQELLKTREEKEDAE